MKVVELKKDEMEYIVGGAITSAWINAISKAINTIYELGKNTGSAIRRLVTGNTCPIN